jgi:hypothetical protein
MNAKYEFRYGTRQINSATAPASIQVLGLQINPQVMGHSSRFEKIKGRARIARARRCFSSTVSSRDQNE